MKSPNNRLPENWLPEWFGSTIYPIVTREIPGLRMSVGPEPRWIHCISSSSSGWAVYSLFIGWLNLVLTFRGARALPEVAVRDLGF
jgi:hypothetical protein